MKKHIILILLFAIAIISFAAGEQQELGSIESGFKDVLISGFESFWEMINGLFVVVYIILCAIIMDFSKSEDKAKKLNWFSKFHFILQGLFLSIPLMLLFIWGFELYSRIEIVKLVFSVILSLGIFKIGPHQLFTWLISNGVLKLNIPTKKNKTDG